MGQDVEDRAGTGGGSDRQDDADNRPKGLSRAVAQIAAGHWNGHLDEVVAAVTAQVVKGAVGFRWRIDIPEMVTVDEDDLTLAEVERVAELAGVGPARLTREHMLNSPKVLRAVLRARLETNGATPDESADKTGGLKMNDLVDCIGQYEVNPDPKDPSGGPSPNGT